MIEYSHFDNLTTGVFENTDTVQVIDVPRLHLYPDRLKRVADTWTKFSWDKCKSIGEDESAFTIIFWFTLSSSIIYLLTFSTLVWQ